MKVLVEKRPWGRLVEFLIVEDRNGRTAVGEQLVMRTLTEEQRAVWSGAPTFSVPEGACQELVDQLWAIGFRPSEGSGSAGALAATQKHLEDMRTLVLRTTGGQK